LGGEGHDLREVAIPDFGEVSFGDFVGPVLGAEAAHAPLHVGLTTADPDFADEDVFEGDAIVFAGDFDAVWSAGFWGLEDAFPFAVSVGFALGAFAIP